MVKVRAEQKYVLGSPRKLRLVADAVRKMTPFQAVDYLAASNKRSAGVFLKVLKQAIANAEHNFKLGREDLFFEEILINAGPDFKRGRAGAKGIYKPYYKRTAHVRIVLVSKEGGDVGRTVKSQPKVVATGAESKRERGGVVGRRLTEVADEKQEVGRSVKTEVKKIQRRTTHK